MNTSKKDNVVRVITPHDLVVAKRLKAIYNRKKTALNLTQAKLEKITGYKQATISCHMNGHIALRGLKGIVAYANALQVDPKEIDPRFTSTYTSVDARTEMPVPMSDLHGKPKTRVSKILTSGLTTLQGFILNDEYAPLFPKNTLVLSDKSIPIKKGSLIMIQIEDRYALARMHEITQRSITYSMPWGFNSCRDQAIRNGKATHDEVDVYYAITPIKVPLGKVTFVSPVIAIELP